MLNRALVLILLFVGCTSNKRVYHHSYHLRGEYQHYSVEVEKRVILATNHETCVERIIVLRARAGLRPAYVVQYVRGVDRGCDDSLDEVRFRNAQDRYKNGHRLRSDIINAYHSIAWR